MAKQLGIKGKLNVVATIELVLKIALTALFAVFTVVMIMQKPNFLCIYLWPLLYMLERVV